LWLGITLPWVAGCGEFGSSDLESHPAVGRQLSGLALKPLVGQGQPVTLDGLKGKVVLLNFWATWCPPCRMELPHIAQLQKKFSAMDDVQVLPINSDDASQGSDQLSLEVTAMLRDLKIELTVYSDPYGVSRDAVMSLPGFDDMAIPTTLVLDRQGVVRYVWVGYGPGLEHRMEQAITDLLEGSTAGER
jgi:thiol-disulfide isomerase/thioredoxin